MKSQQLHDELDNIDMIVAHNKNHNLDISLLFSFSYITKSESLII